MRFTHLPRILASALLFITMAPAAQADEIAPAYETSSSQIISQPTDQASLEEQAQSSAPVAQAAAAGFTTRGAIGTRWRADGGTRSPYGNPTSAETCSNGICYQRFERGTALVWSVSTGTHLLRGAIAERWLQAGASNSSFGAPVSEEVPLGSGKIEQLFLKNGRDAAMYWTPSTGAHYVSFSGAVGGHWAKWGNFRQIGKYGFPTSDEQCGYVHDSCFQRFELGTIVWSPQWGTFRIGGAIRTRWESAGGINSVYGIPVANEAHPKPGHTAEQLFHRNGMGGGMYWTDMGTGTHFVNFRGGIGSYWADNGNFRASGIDTPQKYGYPTTDETCLADGCYQKYQYGIVTWKSGRGAAGAGAEKCMALNNGRSKYSAQGAHRVALALAPRYSNYRKDPVGSHGTLYSCRNLYGMYIQDWKTEAAFGENGFLAPSKRIRDSRSGQLLPAGVTGDTASAYSPTGSYGLSNPFGKANPGTGFSGYHTLNSASRWGGDPYTWYYNKYVENSALGDPNENMWDYMNRGEYRQGILIDYNRNPDGSIPSGNAGFAIMLHTIKYPSVDRYNSSVANYQSWGCVVIAPDRLTQFLREGKDGDRMIMGVESEVMNW